MAKKKPALHLPNPFEGRDNAPKLTGAAKRAQSRAAAMFRKTAKKGRGRRPKRAPASAIARLTGVGRARKKRGRRADTHRVKPHASQGRRRFGKKGTCPTCGNYHDRSHHWSHLSGESQAHNYRKKRHVGGRKGRKGARKKR